MNALTAQLYELEQRLQTGSVRKSAAQLGALLTPDFLEVGGSGQVYDKAQIMAALSSEEPAEITMTDFNARPLGKDVALVTYRAMCVRGGVALQSLRSSVWLQSDAGWQLTFHQGTRS